MVRRPPILAASISTTNFSRAYLERAWNDRDKLTEYERNGFAIFFYITITGHVEATMTELMELRLMYTRSVVSQLKDGDFSWGNSKEDLHFPTSSIHDTLMSLVANFTRRLEKAPLDALIELFQNVFAVKLSTMLGDDHDDLKALANLRNVFAHGREFWVRFNKDADYLMSLDENPLQLPAQRLFAAKVLKTLEFDGNTHHDFQRAFFSDEAMLYFLGRAKDIEKKLRSTLEFIPEKNHPLMVSLPDLSA